MGVRFDKTYSIATTALRMFGAHPSDHFNIRWIMPLLVTYVIMGLVFVSIIYSSFYENFTKVCTNMAIAIVFVMACFIHGVLIMHKKTFNDLIIMMEDDWDRAETLHSGNEIIVLKYTKRGERVLKMWYLVCIVSGALFLMEPLMFTVYSALIGDFQPVQILDIIYPEYIDRIKHRTDMYFIVYGLQTVYCVFSTILSTGFYPLGFIFELHACGQLEVVIRKLEKLFEGYQIDFDTSRNKIKDIATNIRKIYRFVDKIEKTHQATYEMFLKTTAITVPITFFGVIECYNNDNIGGSLDLISHICVFFLQCYFPCYYCDLLLNKGEELRVAVYTCGWERHFDKGTRSAILIVLAWTSRPLAVNAVFCRVSLDTFKNVCHQAYSIFNVMNAARK